MAFPIIKLLIVSFRYVSRPLNNLITRAIKAKGSQSDWGLRLNFMKFG